MGQTLVNIRVHGALGSADAEALADTGATHRDRGRNRVLIMPLSPAIAMRGPGGTCPSPICGGATR